MSSIPLSLVPLRTSTMGDLWHHVGGTPVQVVIIVVAAATSTLIGVVGAIGCVAVSVPIFALGQRAIDGKA